MIRKVLYSVAEPSARRFFHVSAIQRPASHLYSRTSFMMMSTEAGTEKTEGEPKVETETVDEDVQIDPMKALEDANEALEKQVKEMKDKMLRALADEENVRRIAKRDVENARIYANTKFAKSLLDVADNLERALEAANSSNEADHVAFDNLVEGVKMTQNQLTKVFQSHGVVKYGAVGEPFDPTLHDALFRMPDPSKPENTIGQLLKPGYKLHDRVIRAAEVGTITSN